MRGEKFVSVFLLIPLIFLSQLAVFQFTANVNAQTATTNPSTVATLTGQPIQFTETSDYVRLNFTMFIVEFYKGTAGYNVIYHQNGSVLVYEDRIVLEYWTGKQWKQRGEPIGITWNKINDYHYEITRLYDDYEGTIYNVTYTVKSDSPIKITINLVFGQTDTYRIAWYPSGITKLTYAYEEANFENVGLIRHRIVFGDKEAPHDWIGFDWSDVIYNFGNIIETNVEDVANGKKANIYFKIGVVEAGQTITVDPSVVGTSSNAYATVMAFQRKSFYANGRFWVFFTDGTNVVYSTSTDGVTWTSPTAIRAGSYGYRFSIWFDGVYLHYAYASSSQIYYRRGTPNSDGSISWSAVEQTVSTKWNHAIRPMVTVDSNGYVWIGYADYDPDAAVYYPFVIKSGNNDGTWGTTPSGFPYQLSFSPSSSWEVIVVPLTNGKMFAGYIYNYGYVYGQSWDGSSWKSEVSTALTVRYSQYCSAVAQGDDVHLVFLKSTGYDIIHVKYDYASNDFSSEVTVIAGAEGYSAPVLSIDDAGKLYCFWATKKTGSPSGATANHIYYQISTDGGQTWSSPVDWIDESSEVLTYADHLTCFYKQYGNYTGLVYMTKTSGPYNVKFAYLTIGIAPPPEEWHSLAYDFSLYKMKWNSITFPFNLLTFEWHKLAFPFILSSIQWHQLSYIYDLTIYGWHKLTYPFILYTMQWNILNYTFQAMAMMWRILTFPFTFLAWYMWHRLIYPFEVFTPIPPVIPPVQPWYADTRLILMFAFCLFFTAFLMKKLMLD